MGMVLSAVGACLLFILKVAGILLLIILVLAALLLLCPFCADVCWQNDTLTVKAGALGITFPVFQYPKPEPPAQPEEPKGFTGRLKTKFRAWRAERKRKKAEKKAAQPKIWIFIFSPPAGFRRSYCTTPQTACIGIICGKTGNAFRKEVFA